MMQIKAKEKLLHVLMEQTSQTVFVEVLKLELVDKSAIDARLAPLEDAYFEVYFLFGSLQSVDFALLLIDKLGHMLRLFVMLVRQT